MIVIIDWLLMKYFDENFRNFFVDVYENKNIFVCFIYLDMVDIIEMSLYIS